MIITEPYGVRIDGVPLYLTVDALVDESGNPVRDEKGNLVPTGFKIKQVETGEPYDQAIDVEDATYTCVETDLPIEVRTLQAPPQRSERSKL
jgi:hypothetical protein